jgi:hypothetical protein
MTGTNCKNHWSWRPISPSLALSTSCQSSSQITAPVHSPSVNSPSIYLIAILYLFIYLPPLHPSISTCTFIFCTSTIPVFKCYIVITLPQWPIYCLNSLILPHLHSLYIDFFFLLYYWLCLFIPCVTPCCCMCLTAMLYLGQVAVVNENLFSTSLPG